MLEFLVLVSFCLHFALAIDRDLALAGRYHSVRATAPRRAHVRAIAPGRWCLGPGDRAREIASRRSRPGDRVHVIAAIPRVRSIAPGRSRPEHCALAIPRVRAIASRRSRPGDRAQAIAAIPRVQAIASGRSRPGDRFAGPSRPGDSAGTLARVGAIASGPSRPVDGALAIPRVHVPAFAFCGRDRTIAPPKICNTQNSLV